MSTEQHDDEVMARIMESLEVERKQTVANFCELCKEEIEDGVTAKIGEKIYKMCMECAEENADRQEYIAIIWSEHFLEEVKITACSVEAACEITATDALTCLEMSDWGNKGYSVTGNWILCHADSERKEIKSGMVGLKKIRLEYEYNLSTADYYKVKRIMKKYRLPSKIDAIRFGLDTLLKEDVVS